MNDIELKFPRPKIEAKFISALENADIEELCDATEDAILVDGVLDGLTHLKEKIG